MKATFLVAAAAAALATSACASEQDQAEDRLEQQAEASARQAGDAIAALGLTERQLLDADLRATDGTELGDVEAVLRDANGQVDRLVVEVEDSNPDRFVEVPIAGLTTRPDGNDTDLVTTMTRAEIDALPDAVLPTR